MSDQHILTETADGVCTITFNRPEKKNAFTVKMYEDLVAAMKKAADDNSVRVLLFTGAGNAFTSGNDVLDFVNTPPTGEDSPVFQFLLNVVDYEKPIVCAVNGVAVGIGTTMLMHCDLVYAADTAKFTTPFVPLGLVPEGASSYLLPRFAGQAKTNEMLLLGEPVDANFAQDIGLVARVVPAAELMTLAKNKARRLAELPPGAIRDAKKLIRSHSKEAVKKALYDEAVVFATRLGSAEAMEALTAFVEKRKPDFSKLSS
jgi:enoyl-CoA hydratase/carnithine racemase